MKKRKGTLSDSDGSGTAKKAQPGEAKGVGGARGDVVKKEGAQSARTTVKEAGASNGGSSAPDEHLIRRASASTTT